MAVCLDAPMLERSVAKMTRGRDALNTILEAARAQHAAPISRPSNPCVVPMEKQ